MPICTLAITNVPSRNANARPSSDNSYFVWVDLTAAYAQTGDMTKAAAAKAELLRRVPDFSISRFERKQFSNNPIWVKGVREHFVPGWRKAGLPE